MWKSSGEIYPPLRRGYPPSLMANRRKADHLKALEGTARPDRAHPEPEFPVVVSPDEAPAPDWLSGMEAVEEWRRVVGLLLPVRVLSQADLTHLAHYCNLHAACVKMWRASMSPTAAELTQLRLFGTEFGLTPASRSKVGGNSGGKKASAFDEFKPKVMA